jgi:hypothetical protein
VASDGPTDGDNSDDEGPPWFTVHRNFVFEVRGRGYENEPYDCFDTACSAEQGEYIKHLNYAFEVRGFECFDECFDNAWGPARAR